MEQSGRTSVFGLVGELPECARLMCPLWIPTSKMISGQGVAPLDISPKVTMSQYKIVYR
jgi:hypothetical protein